MNAAIAFPVVLSVLSTALWAQQNTPQSAQKPADTSPHSIQFVPNASHFVFRSDEAEVLPDMNDFIVKLPQ